MRFCEASPFMRRCFHIVLLELFLGDVAVIALQLLLGAQLNAEIADLALAALAVLAGAIFAAVDRALRTSEDILAHAAVELVFGAGALRHDLILQFALRQSARNRAADFLKDAGSAGPPLHRTCGVNCEGRQLAKSAPEVKPELSEARS